MTQRTLTVVGLGYVGLPLALLARAKGWEVTGLDTNQAKVDQINQQQSPLDDPAITKQLADHPFTATTDPSQVSSAEVIVIAVPTPVTDNHEPDLTPLKQALTNLSPHLSGGQLIVIESTINPGVMDEVVVPLLEQAGVAVDADQAASNPVYLAHCPERINPGDTKWTIRNIPRVLGGYSAAGTERARDFYENILDGKVTVMDSVTEAEAVKILENTFRDVNIAFVNEMARSFAKLDIDVTNVIAGAATKPFAFMPHYPGNGVGGHCISVDPYYMIERGRQAGFDHEFLKLAREINNGMPAYTVELLEQGLTELSKAPKNPTVALLGLAYKKNIDDIRESPALEIQQILKAKGYPITVFDPHLPEASTVDTLDAALADAQVVMLATDHDEFIQQLTPQKLQEAGIVIVVDGRNALDADAIASSGIPYYGIGRKRLPLAS